MSQCYLNHRFWSFSNLLLSLALHQDGQLLTWKISFFQTLIPFSYLAQTCFLSLFGTCITETFGKCNRCSNTNNSNEEDLRMMNNDFLSNWFCVQGQYCTETMDQLNCTQKWRKDKCQQGASLNCLWRTKTAIFSVDKSFCYVYTMFVRVKCVQT